MSSATGGAMRSLQETRAAAMDTLARARDKLRRVAIVFIAGLLATIYALQEWVWDALKAMTTSELDPAVLDNVEIIATTPFDVILLQAKLGLVVGGVLSAPLLIYYGRDALEERGWWPSVSISRLQLAGFVVAILGLFLGGTAYGYFVFFPFMFRFLASNAVSAGIEPTYSIVDWTQFIIFLSASFGLAAQIPLAMSGLTYTDVVSYRTFREKWRHAVVGIFVFGALFSPPEPFTQIMWATPLLILYGASLYLCKVVTLVKRHGASVQLTTTAAQNWAALAAAALGASAIGYGAATAEIAAVRDIALVPAAVAPRTGLVVAAVFGLAGAVAALAYYVYVSLATAARTADELGGPATIDLETLDAGGVQAAPPEAFAAMDESEAVTAARSAMDADNPEKAQAILDRYEAVEEAEEESDDEETAERDPVESATTTFFDGVTDEDTDEEDIGGYYYDLAFILDSLTSKAFRIVGTFAVVMSVTFFWLYRGGLGAVRQQFLSRLPDAVQPEEMRIVALHPVEALIFEMKVSVILGLVATLPVLLYYAWPSLKERGLAGGDRRVLFVWGGGLVAGLIGGSALGFGVVAPELISFLVADAREAGMIISYRLRDFFWLVFMTTVGVGLLADIPISMVLFQQGGLVPYRIMRNRWREFVLTVTILAAFFTPGSLLSMLIVLVPVVAAYGVGLGVLWVLTLGGRRE
jgi:sec-independent protein translocase protein TatC